MSKVLLLLSVAGVLFSGYVSFSKIFNGFCPFGEMCPYFFGIPACYIGLVLFFLILILSFLINFFKHPINRLYSMLLTVAFAGMAFSGYYTNSEIPLFLNLGPSAYYFGLPTCAIGFLFYTAIFLIVLKLKRNN